MRRGAIDFTLQLLRLMSVPPGTIARQGFARQYTFFIGTTKKRKIVAENLTCPWRSVDKDANLAMENSLSCFRLAQCYMTINSVKQQWQHFIRSLDSERRKRQHHKNQVQWYARRESKHLRSAYNVRSRVQQPMFGERQNALLLLSNPPQRRPSGAVAHDFGSHHRKRKAPEESPRRCVRDC